VTTVEDIASDNNGEGPEGREGAKGEKGWDSYCVGMYLIMRLTKSYLSLG
jgi:hypothetical protein